MPVKTFRRKGSAIWHYRGTVDGHRLRGSTRTTDKTIAQRIAAEKEARHWKRRLDGPESVTTFANCVAVYQASGKPQRFIIEVLDYWKDTPVRNITASAIKDSCQKLYPNAGPATWNRQVIAVTQAIINHASEQELCPPLKVRRFKVVSRVKQPATWTWVQAFMSEASPHLGALACFMFLTGARISEALSVTWADVDFSTRQSLIKQTKVGSERRANLPPPLITAMANIQGDRSGPAFKFRSRHNLKTQWESAIRRAGIKPLTPHCMRHGFATEMLRKGFDVKTVAEAGGWKDAATVLKTYAHALRDPRITDALVGADLTNPALRNAESVDKITA